MDILPVRFEVDDWIANDLAWPVIGHVAASTRLEDVDAERGKVRLGRDDIRAAAVALDAQGNDGRVLQKNEEIGDAIRTALLHEGALHGERLGVGNNAEPP